MRTKQVIQKEIGALGKEIEALTKELETAPEDIAQMPDGLYWFLECGIPMVMTKFGNMCSAFNTVKGYGVPAVTVNDYQKWLNDGSISSVKILQNLDQFGSIKKINVDWESIDNHWGNVWQSEDPMDFRHGEYELLKIAKWARPLLEGK